MRSSRGSMMRTTTTMIELTDGKGLHTLRELCTFSMRSYACAAITACRSWQARTVKPGGRIGE
jgi:hypothetical protein